MSALAGEVVTAGKLIKSDQFPTRNGPDVTGREPLRRGEGSLPVTECRKCREPVRGARVVESHRTRHWGRGEYTLCLPCARTMLGEYRYELFTRPRFTIICRWCGRTAYYTDWVWRVVCSDYCRDRLRPSSQTRAAARIGRPCEVCGDPFTPPRSDGRYCSPACRQKAYRRRNRGGG